MNADQKLKTLDYVIFPIIFIVFFIFFLLWPKDI